MTQSELFHHFKAYFRYSYKVHHLLCQYLKTDAPILLRGKRLTPKTGHFEYEKEKELYYAFYDMFRCVVFLQIRFVGCRDAFIASCRIEIRFRVLNGQDAINRVSTTRKSYLWEQ